MFADFLLTYFFVSQVFPCLRHSQALVIHNSRTSSFVVHYWRSSYEQELKQALFLFADFLLTKNVPDRNLYIADSCQGRITVVPPLFMNILVILIKKVTLLTGYATCMLNSLSDTINISFPCNARPRRKLLLIHLTNPFLTALHADIPPPPALCDVPSESTLLIIDFKYLTATYNSTMFICRQAQKLKIS